LDTPSDVPSISNIKAKQSTSSQLPGLADDTLCKASNLFERSPKAISISLKVNDLELMHFYTTTTSLTLSSRPEFQQIWQKEVPRIAFAHPFLLHGILGFSALHLARSQPERKALLYTEASAHHEIGLRMFRNTMSNITPQNCEACFAFSSIISAYAWASSDRTGDLFFQDTSTSNETSSVEWASLVRGVYTLIQLAGKSMTTGRMKSILQPRYLDPEIVRAADPEVTTNLTALNQLWDCSVEKFSIEELEVLNETLSLLLQALALVALSSTNHEIDTIVVVYGWPIKVPEGFFAMVKEQIPEALILLAHYSLLLNKVDHLWYVQGMSRRLLQTIHGKIGKEWESWITWPLQALVVTEFQN
jgi:hypothetical protein